MISPGRNSPCPCGSGKRYKDCHGTLSSPNALPADDVAIRSRLDAALAAQQAGRLREAISLYEAVIAREPRNFDAVHMLGVIHYQRGEFDRAHALVSTALAIAPTDAAARHNMALIEGVLEHRVIERAICAETLPRFAKRCVAPPDSDERWKGLSIDVIASKSDMRNEWGDIQRLVDWLDATCTLWMYPRTPLMAPSTAVRTIDPGTSAIPAQRTAIFYGADISPAAWYGRSLAADVALYCDTYDACALIDRIPELANEGRTPIRLLFASQDVARRTGLHGRVVDAISEGRRP